MAGNGKMVDVVGERRVIHGLRHRATGEMLRVEHRADVGGDPESPHAETTYSFGTDPEYPIYDAGSAERLALAFSSQYGSGPDSPLPGGIRPEDVEPVAIEEIVTRTVRPTGIPFDVPVTVDARHAVDLNRRQASHFEGLGPILDAVALADADLRAQRHAGSPHAWDRYYLVGLIVPGAADDLPEGWAGSILRDRHGNNQRRALAALPAPGDWLGLVATRGERPGEATLVVCLGDTRPVPASLSEALADLSPGTSRAPR